MICQMMTTDVEKIKAARKMEISRSGKCGLQYFKGLVMPRSWYLSKDLKWRESTICMSGEESSRERKLQMQKPGRRILWRSARRQCWKGICRWGVGFRVRKEAGSYVV